MLPYFPFASGFDLKIGTSALSANQLLLECDNHYVHEVALRRQLLAQDHRYYYREGMNTLAAQWEVVDKILKELADQYPQYFHLSIDGDTWTWSNTLLKEEYVFEFNDSATLPVSPLDFAGRQVQEDLLLLSPQSVLIAGQLCFPSGWCLDDKFGNHFLSLHSPLPVAMTPMMETANKFIERIPVGKAFQRNNWGFRVSNELDLSSRHTPGYLAQLQKVSSEATSRNIGEQLYIRIEHQTLSRLPLSQCVLFTIHTYQNKVADEITSPDKASTLLHFIQSVPPELLDYKLMTPFAGKLIEYLTAFVKEN